MSGGRIAALLLAAALVPGCADLGDVTGGTLTPSTAPAVTAPAAGPGATAAGTGDPTTLAPPVTEPLIPDVGVARLVPEVLATTAHDPTAFTQGLEYHDGFLLESTGGYGTSDRRRVDPATGAVLAAVPLPAEQFGEGLTVAGGRLVQLTWKEGVAIVADPATLEATGSFSYTGEGWGLCSDGTRLVMSDGSPVLTFRDLETFQVTGQVTVTLDGVPVEELNELECADGLVWANVWGATDIVAITPGTGEVRAVVDASSLVPEGLAPGSVLNGIARRPGSDTFWLTGKNWPVLHEVRLVPA